MLYIDDARAGQYQWAFDSAALRFWRPHQGESLYVSSAGMWPDGFHVRVRNHRNQRHSLLVVQVGSDPEQAILTALEEWWAGRPVTDWMEVRGRSVEVYYVECKNCNKAIELDRKPRGENLATAFSSAWNQSLVCPVCGARANYEYIDIKTQL